MQYLLVILFIALCCANAYDQEFICRRMRGKCLPASTCNGKRTLYPCNEAGNVCCLMRQSREDSVTKPPTVATTLKPEIKAKNLAVLNCGLNKYSENDLEERIIGGYEAKIGQWPWLVSLRDDGEHQCGGSIINRQWVLTAAHCFKRTSNPSSWTVVTGEHDRSVSEGHEVEVGVNRIFMPEYDSLTRVNDIALLLLDEPLPDKDPPADANHLHEEEEREDFRINEICLPSPEDVLEEGTLCYLMGWGLLSNGGTTSVTLQEITVPILDLDLCVAKYNKTVNGVRTFNPYLIDRSQICAGDLKGEKDSCQGDSGGPLTCRRSDGRFFVAGLTSYSIGCGYEETPGVYTNTAAHLDWITETIAANTEEAAAEEAAAADAAEADAAKGANTA